MISHPPLTALATPQPADDLLLLRVTRLSMKRWWRKLGWWLLASALLLITLGELSPQLRSLINSSWQLSAQYPLLLNNAFEFLFSCGWLVLTFCWMLAALRAMALIRDSLEHEALSRDLLSGPGAFILTAVQGLPLAALLLADAVLGAVLREIHMIPARWGMLGNSSLWLRLADDLGNFAGSLGALAPLGLLLCWLLVRHPHGARIWKLLLVFSALAVLLRLLPVSNNTILRWEDWMWSLGAAYGLLLAVLLVWATLRGGRELANTAAGLWLASWFLGLGFEFLRPLIARLPAGLAALCQILVASAGGASAMLPWAGIQEFGRGRLQQRFVLSWRLLQIEDLPVPAWSVLALLLLQLAIIWLVYRGLLRLARHSDSSFSTTDR